MNKDHSFSGVEGDKEVVSNEAISPPSHGQWEGFCLDDGSGRNIQYIDKYGKKSRIVPANYVPETFPNGMRKYYWRGKCCRCKKTTLPSLIIAGGGTFGFGMNYCDDCLITTTPGITKILGNGDAIWAANLDTPLHAYIDLLECLRLPNREEAHLERSKAAKLEVNTLSKHRRNADRAKYIKRFALQNGIGKGEHISWGFGEVYDEYFGEVNDKGEPHGLGVKVYSDKSVYIGHWQRGERHTTESASWVRMDGTQYEGSWMNDHKHGKGVQKYPDGTEYRGEFAKGYEHGQGIRTYTNGDRFEGRFRFGKRDGPGTLYHENGTVEKRIFRENDVVHEKAIPPVYEGDNEKEEVYFQPESLLVLGIRAVAKAMHVKRSVIPSALVRRRLSEYFKEDVAKEFLETIHPRGSQDFINAAPFQAFRLLSVISYRHVKFHHYDAESFLYFTSSNSSLQTLEIVNARLDSSSLEMISKAIRGGSWPHLQILNFSFNRIDVTIVQSLIGALKDGAPQIRSLLLAGSQVSPQGGALIAKYLSENPSLQELDLAFNMVQAAGAERLAEALILNTNLTKLNLRQNSIGTIGAEALVEAMKVNLSLRVICIADNKIGTHLATALSARLRGTTKEVAESFCASQLQVPAIHLHDYKQRFKH